MSDTFAEVCEEIMPEHKADPEEQIRVQVAPVEDLISAFPCARDYLCECPYGDALPAVLSGRLY